MLLDGIPMDLTQITQELQLSESEVEMLKGLSKGSTAILWEHEHSRKRTIINAEPAPDEY
jgi:hypothetical protein